MKFWIMSVIVYVSVVWAAEGRRVKEQIFQVAFAACAKPYTWKTSARIMYREKE